jgi:hypothetical protein
MDADLKHSLAVCLTKLKPADDGGLSYKNDTD